MRGSPRRTLERCDFTYGNYSNILDYLQYLQGLRKGGTTGPASRESEAIVEPHDRDEEDDVASTATAQPGEEMNAAENDPEATGQHINTGGSVSEGVGKMQDKDA